ADVAAAVVSVVCRRKRARRHLQPHHAVPCPPQTIVAQVGARRPAILVVTATHVRIVRRLPASVDVVTQGLADGAERQHDGGRDQDRLQNHAGSPMARKLRSHSHTMPITPRANTARPTGKPMISAAMTRGPVISYPAGTSPALPCSPCNRRRPWRRAPARR